MKNIKNFNKRPEIILIAAVTADFGIGFGNDLLVKSSEDMKHFKETTMGHPVIMGRKTFESMGSRLLPNRFNVIVSNNDSIDVKFRKADEGKNITDLYLVAKTNDILCDLIFSDNTSKLRQSEKIFIIGGQSIYEQFLPFADKLILTEFDVEKEADTFFPASFHEEFSQDSSVRLAEEENIPAGFINTYFRK
jgi:dihydrofolate reductase